MNESIWIGFDPREADAFAVARHSLASHLTRSIPVRGLVLSHLQRDGLYRRPIEYRPCAVDRPVMWDTISDAPMSTEHAVARFLVPHLAKTGWALFCDGDVLFRGDVVPLFESLDPQFAVYCVKHDYAPRATVKMDGQAQSQYPRKNWSSVMAVNCGHEANRELSLDLINRLPGRDLHRFAWLDDEEIGELGPEWNWLVGHSAPLDDPKIVHFTEGTPAMRGYEGVPYADEWRRHRDEWAAA